MVTPPLDADPKAEDETFSGPGRKPTDAVREQTEKGAKLHSALWAEPCQFQEAAQVRTKRRQVVNIRAMLSVLINVYMYV